MDDGGPASRFHVHLYRTLHDAGVDLPMTHLLVGVLINTMALMRITPRFVLDASTIKDVHELQREIQGLCSRFGVYVDLPFSSSELVSASVIADCKAIGISRRDLLFKNRVSKKMKALKPELLFEFLALVRLFMKELGHENVFALIEDFDDTRPMQFPATVVTREPGVGPRVARNPFLSLRKRRGTDMMVIPSIGKSNSRHVFGSRRLKTRTRFNTLPNLFKSKSRFKVYAPHAEYSALGQPTLDFNDKGSYVRLSGSPNRIPRKTLFGLFRF